MSEPPRLVVAAGIVWCGDRLLVQRRASTAAHGAGRLELPGGKVERGESPRRALARELVEEWGPAAEALRVTGVVDLLHHVYPPPGPEVLLAVFHVDARVWAVADGAWRAAIRPEPGVEVFEVDPTALDLTRFLEADRPMLARIRSGELRPHWQPS